MTRLTTTSVLTVRTVTEGVRGLTACTRKISSTGSSLSVPGTSTHVAQTTWTHRVRKPPSPRGSCPPAPALTPPPSCTHAGPARPPPPTGPGSDAGSPCGLPSSSGAAARRSPPENRSPLRLPRDLLFECRPRQIQSPASCTIGTGGLTRRGQRAAGRPQRSALGPAWQDAGGNRPGRPGPEPVGHVTPSAYVSATAPSGGGRHGSESRPCHRLPGQVTPESQFAHLKDRHELKGMKREEGDGEGEGEEKRASE